MEFFEELFKRNKVDKNECQGQFKIVGIRQSKNVGFGQFN